MIGVICALNEEAEALISNMQDCVAENCGSISFVRGRLCEKDVVVARCGIGKVFAAMCAEAMIIKYNPDLIINSGVGGSLSDELECLDIVVAARALQHDMDTSALGDEKGLISGINKIYFDADKRALDILQKKGLILGVKVKTGVIASGDKFVSARDEKLAIANTFGASVCEMEGAAIAHVAYVNGIPFCIVRAISDSLSGKAAMDYMEFMPKAAEISAKLTMLLIADY